MARRVRRALSILVLLLLILGLGAAYGVRWVKDRLQPVGPGNAEPITVVIPGGATVGNIGETLVEKHLVRDAVVFRYYARYLGVDSQLKPGEYQFTPAMTPAQILDKLARGETVVHRFTIPEGKTVAEIADLLDRAHVVEKAEFLKLAAASKLNARYLPADAKLDQPLEGYLFPATYEYKAGITAADVLGMMYARFEAVWTPDVLAKATADGLTVHQVVTLASIVEKEAQVAKERAVIAGVYTNRLKVGMKLDADPTVAYAVKKPGEELTVKDLQTDSPFNTYLRAGLPPGPIAAPGEASIAAALSPEKNDFWYFVAKGDGSGEHFFAKTLDEQDRNIGLAQANAKKK